MYNGKNLVLIVPHKMVVNNVSPPPLVAIVKEGCQLVLN